MRTLNVIVLGARGLNVNDDVETFLEVYFKILNRRLKSAAGTGSEPKPNKFTIRVTEGIYKSEVEFYILLKAAGGSLIKVAKTNLRCEELIAQVDATEKWIPLEPYDGSESPLSGSTLGIETYWQLGRADSVTSKKLRCIKALSTFVKRLESDTNETERGKEIKTLKTKLEEKDEMIEDYCRKLNLVESQLTEKELLLLNASEMRTKYEREIINIRKRTGDLPSMDIAVGAYEFGGINPSVIEGHWRMMYTNLHQVVVQASKTFTNEHDSAAAREFRSLTGSHLSKINPRLQAYTIVRNISRILVDICGSQIVETTNQYKTDLVEMGKKIGNSPLSRQQFAKDLLSQLDSPENITVESKFSLFDKLPNALQIFLDKFFTSKCEILKKRVDSYSIGNDIVYSSLKKFIYTAIYVTIEMSVISDNSIMAYWSQCNADRQLFGVQQGQAYDDNLHYELETVSKQISGNDSSRFVIFTVFPGCAHFDNTGGRKVISQSRVVSGEPVAPK